MVSGPTVNPRDTGGRRTAVWSAPCDAPLNAPAILLPAFGWSSLSHRSGAKPRQLFEHLSWPATGILKTAKLRQQRPGKARESGNDQCVIPGVPR